MILGAALASVATAVTLRAVQLQANNVEWVSHTLEVREKLAMFRATVRGAGSGIRVYLLTHSDSYLDPTGRGSTIPVQFQELQQLTSGNAAQQVNLARLRPLSKSGCSGSTCTCMGRSPRSNGSTRPSGTSTPSSAPTDSSIRRR